ncbi:hypothetical protein ElyMa_004083600 [Elysia marginata]|uniref:Uncharacterized protein n=1 Tax=Elysia marginata TaxID=1093978 RepID=A0AAV4G8S6_9GAST|nr:hypothetical protein ElyMa_004083600 [Elysia marginata]
MLKAKENWVNNRCNDIARNLRVNSTKKAYQVLKDLSNNKQGRPSTILDKNGKCLTESKDTSNKGTGCTADLFDNSATELTEKLNALPSTDTYTDTASPSPEKNKKKQ